MKSYIYFELVEEKPKTGVYAIYSESSGDRLGTIKWYARWRQYCFFPEDTIWNRGCLREVIDFIQKLMDERKTNKIKRPCGLKLGGADLESCYRRLPDYISPCEDCPIKNMKEKETKQR